MVIINTDYWFNPCEICIYFKGMGGVHMGWGKLNINYNWEDNR